MSVLVTSEPVEVVVSERYIKTVRCDGPGCAWERRVNTEYRGPFVGTRFAVYFGDGHQWSPTPEKHFCAAECMERWAHLEAERLASFSRLRTEA